MPAALRQADSRAPSWAESGSETSTRVGPAVRDQPEGTMRMGESAPAAGRAAAAKSAARRLVSGSTGGALGRPGGDPKRGETETRSAGREALTAIRQRYAAFAAGAAWVWVRSRSMAFLRAGSSCA